MIQRLVGLVLAVAVGWLLSRMLRGAVGGAARSGGPGTTGGPRSDDRGTMVRDRVCNTFLPAARAVRIEVDGVEHHFCSETCRDRFLGDRTAAAGRG